MSTQRKKRPRSLSESWNEFHLPTSFQEADFENMNSKGPNSDSLEPIKCSWIMTVLGRMIFHSPEIESNYENLKKKCLPKDGRKYSHKDLLSNNPELTNIRGIEDSLAKGQLDIHHRVVCSDRMWESNENEEHKVPAKYQYFPFCSPVDKPDATVTETLVYNEYGLGNRFERPKIDWVDLQLPSGKGDYGSAYQGTQNLAGLNIYAGISNLAKKGIAEDGDDADELKGLVTSFSQIQKKLVKHFPKEENDRQIARWLRQISIGEKPSIHFDEQNETLRQVYAIWHLLFKTEVLRFPAALIHHVQMLELIIHGKTTIKYMFADRNAPMSIRGAMMASRHLNTLFNEADTFHSFENPYSYNNKITSEIVIPKVNELVEKQHRLTIMWLKFKFPDQDFGDNFQLTAEFLPKLCKTVMKSLSSFGFSVFHPELLDCITPFDVPSEPQTEEQ